jgi:serine/threonine-protein kinase
MGSGQATSILPSATAPRRGVLPSIGDLLGPYVIDRKLGEGGMGCVYLTHHRENQDEVRAIKVISPELASDNFFVDTFIREARVLSRMNQHDALVQYFFFDRRDDGLVYIVMEFVAGISLGDLLKKGKMQPAEVRLLMERCAHGLATLHNRKIIHRDLKPDNIILKEGKPENAKIVDFGIAKASELGKTVVESGGFVGTPHYASPEQLYGRLIDERSDIYSLGLVLAHAATGKSLRAGLAPHEILKASETLPDLSAVPRELRDDLTKMLQPDPRNRPASMEDLLGVRKKSGGGSKMGLIAAGIVGLLVVGGGAAFLLSKPSSQTADTAPVAKPSDSAAIAPASPPPSAAKPATVAPVAPPSLDAIAATLTTQLSQYDCAGVMAKADNGKIVLSGFVQSDYDKNRAVTQAGQSAGAPVVSRLDVAPWPFCAVRQMAATMPEQGNIQIEPSHPDGEYKIGDVIAETITPPAGVSKGWMTVDVIDASGNFLQLLPATGAAGSSRSGWFNANAPVKIGFPGSPYPEITASPPVGQMMILAIYSENKLDVPQQDGEDMHSYLPRLRSAVSAASGDTSASFTMLNVVK